jgi:hypothetical protein
MVKQFLNRFYVVQDVACMAHVGHSLDIKTIKLHSCMRGCTLANNYISEN